MKFINSFISTFKKMSNSKRKLEEQVEPAQKRLKCTETKVILAEAQTFLTPFGIFGRTPIEVMHLIFSYLTASQLSTLASCSKAYATEIYQFLLTKEAAQKFYNEAKSCENHGNNLQYHFCDYGHLINICGVILSSDQRTQLLLMFFHNTKELVENPHGWGRLFRTVTLKWSYEQRLQFFQSLIDFELRELIDLVIKTPIDEAQDEQIEVRRKLRGYFLDVEFKDPKDAAFWFSVVLRLQQRAFDQAKLLLTLYAPVIKDGQGEERVDYRNLAEIDIVSAADADHRLSQLSTAFGKLLHAIELDFSPASFDYGIEQLRWSKPELFNLIEEVTTFPEPWPMQNFVAMLLQSHRLIPIAISYRILHGFGDEAGTIMFMLNTFALRWRPTSTVLVYNALKEVLKTLSSRNCALLFEKIMQEQIKYIQESWPIEPTWNQTSVRSMEHAFNSSKELLSMFQIALPLTFITR
uniref:F-box domain-containing protein n=1 Tax=Acrobeloides nanus TaxID=290746 RepID=A0A914CES8_9BILA